ncbi:MAG: hypothetical protein WBR10_04630 [Candidatus Acidiferrum sp.]
MIIPAVKRTILWTMAVALTGGLSLASPEARGEEPAQQDSVQVMKLLKEARSEAARLRVETDKLESYKNGRLSRGTHGRQLEITKGHVNELGKTLDKLEARKAEASPWQQRAIEEMRPVLEELADQTTRAIQYLNENPRQLQHPDYHEVLTDKSALAAHLADLLDDHVRYGEAKAELEELEAKVSPLS